jgi:hypothetical protein
MTDHGRRRRRFNAPNPVSTIAAPTSSNHRPSPPGGGFVGGPVEASAVPADGETDGASACIAGEGAAVDVASAVGVVLATVLAEGAVVRDGAVAVGARGGGHTWLNDTADGCAPLPTE